MIKLPSKDVLKLRRSCLVRPQAQLSLLAKAKAYSGLVVHSGLLSVWLSAGHTMPPLGRRAPVLLRSSMQAGLVQSYSMGFCAGISAEAPLARSWLQLCRRTTCLKAETMDSQVRPGLPWFVPLNIEQYSVNAAQSSRRDRRIGGEKIKGISPLQRCIACLVPRGSVAVCSSLNTSFF